MKSATRQKKHGFYLLYLRPINMGILRDCKKQKPDAMNYLRLRTLVCTKTTTTS